MENIKIYGKRIIQVLIVVVICIILWQQWLKAEREDLIKTPSSHEQIEYLEIAVLQEDEEYEIEFIIYDRECNYLQFCVIGEPEPYAFPEPKEVSFKIDGVLIEDHSLCLDTAWSKKRVIYFLDNVSDFSKVEFSIYDLMLEATFAESTDIK